MISKTISSANLLALAKEWYADLSNRLGLCIDLTFPTGDQVLTTTRNFVLKPYYRRRATQLIGQFREELAAAPARYKLAWGRLRLAPPAVLESLKPRGPYAHALSHLRELLAAQCRLTNRRWYQVSSMYDWADLRFSTDLCLKSWRHEVARCGLKLCQARAEDFIPQHFQPERAAVILAQVKGVSFPEPGSGSRQWPVVIEGTCERLD